MRPSFWLRLDMAARRLTPFGLTFSLLLIGVVPLHLPAFASVAPMLPLIAIYYWTLYRPDLMPVAAVFIVGLMYDALRGAPIGANAAVFVVVHGIIDSQRRFFTGKSFSIAWLGFALVSAGAFSATWILVCVYHGTLVTPDPLMFQYMLTLGCFPVLSWVFLRWQLAFLKQA